jgi:transcriptional regulator with XRE-family HTH domain
MVQCPFQEHVGELSGLHRNYVSEVERAERTPSIVAADKLARVLGTTLLSMLGEVERESDAS